MSKEDHYKIKNRVKESTATGAEIKLNKVLIAYFKYETSFRDELTWQDIKATQDTDAAKILENSWVRTTMKDPNMIRSYDNNTKRFAGYPEMVKLRLPYPSFVGEADDQSWIYWPEQERLGYCDRARIAAKMANLYNRKPLD